MTAYSPATIAQTTPTGAAMAQFVSQHYGQLGEVRHGELLRRSFNQVYGLHFGNGRRAVARLSVDRPRGMPNLGYEAALLAHLDARGVPVANALPARNGDVAIAMDLPEGPRMVMLFEHLDGELPGESLVDIEATGRGLALLHQAAQDYAGPASLYGRELPDLLHKPLAALLNAPTMDDTLRGQFSAIAQRLETRIAAMPGLTRVHCHGDCHCSNNFMTDGADGTRIATFFDFEEASPGLLAYELGVYLWVMLPRKVGRGLDAAALERWQRYIAGYRSVRDIAAGDYAAIAAMLAVRQFWLLGENAGRVAVWGTQTLPTKGLREQVELLTAWESLVTPE